MSDTETNPGDDAGKSLQSLGWSAHFDAALAEDPMSRVACETSATRGLVFVFGEITTGDSPFNVRVYYRVVDTVLS